MERIAVIMGKMHSGGKKNLVMEYYRHIDRNKIQFDFICDIDSNAIPEDEIVSLGGQVYIIPPYQNIVQNLLAIHKICRENQYRIMHAYNGTLNLFPMFIGWETHIPVRINESISMAHDADKKTIIKKLLKPFSRLFATHFMANGEACGKWQFGEKLFRGGRVQIFKTIINTSKNRYDPAMREKTRAEYGLGDKLVLGHIGRLTEQKNTLFIIDIFAEVLKIEPEAILLIIGEGNLREEMIKKVSESGLSESVLYLGRREDIHQFYNAMDSFLLPSLYEGLPVVGVEAETHGLPVFFQPKFQENPVPVTTWESLQALTGALRSGRKKSCQLQRAIYQKEKTDLPMCYKPDLIL